MEEDESQGRDDQQRAQTGKHLHQRVLEFAPAVSAILVVEAHQFCGVTAGPAKAFKRSWARALTSNGDAQQHQADFKEGAQIVVRGGLGEFVGDDTGQGVARGKAGRRRFPGGCR